MRERARERGSEGAREKSQGSSDRRNARCKVRMQTGGQIAIGLLKWCCAVGRCKQGNDHPIEDDAVAVGRSAARPDLRCDGITISCELRRTHKAGRRQDRPKHLDFLVLKSRGRHCVIGVSHFCLAIVLTLDSGKVSADFEIWA